MLDEKQDQIGEIRLYRGLGKGNNMSLSLCYNNTLVGSTVACTSSASGFPSYRLHDKDATLPWRATTNVLQYITIINTVAKTIDRWIVTGHNLESRTITLEYSDNPTDHTPTWVQLDQIAATIDTINRSISSASHKGYRITIEAGATVSQIGELFLGITDIILRNTQPTSSMGERRILVRELSESGKPWIIENGPSKWYMNGSIAGLEVTDMTKLQNAFDALFFFFKDDYDVWRYVESETGLSGAELVHGHYNIDIDLEEVEKI